MEFCSAMKNKILPFAGEMRRYRNIMLSEIS